MKTSIRVKRTICGILSTILILTGCTESTNTDREPFSYMETGVTQFTQKDSDEDGYSDLAEVIVGSDPYSKSTFDKEHPATVNITREGISVDLKGTPGIADTYVEIYDSPSIQNRGLLLSPVYELYNPSFEKDIFEAKITINYKGEPDSDVAIYQYHDDGSLTLVDSSIVEGNSVTAVLPHFSKYTVAERVLKDISQYREKAFALCIDDSGSMFNSVMAKDKILGNDNENERWRFVKTFYEKYGEDIVTCISYTNDIVKLFSSGENGSERITAHSEEIDKLCKTTNKEEFDEVNENSKAFKLKLSGTNTSRAAVEAIQELEATKALSKYLVVLTDGNDTNKSHRNQYVNLMQSNPDIVPIFISLGNNVSADSLKYYTAYNHGYTFYIKDSSLLTELDMLLSAVVTGIDEEASKALSKAFGYEIEAEILADSGYRKAKDSLPFTNSRFVVKQGDKPNNGLCYGYAYTEQEHYLTGFIYDSKPKYNTNWFRSIFSDEVNYTYLEFTPKHLTKDNYNAVVNRLAEIISVHQRSDSDKFMHIVNTEGLTSYQLKETSPLVKFFAGYTITKDGNERFTAPNGEKYQQLCYYFPEFNTINVAVNQDFANYTDLTELDKACVEFMYLLMYNFNLQSAGLEYKNLLSYAFSDFWLEEAIKTLSSQHLCNGSFEGYTAMQSIYNHLRAGIPAILATVPDGGLHAVLCSRMFRDKNNPTIIYLEIDDSNSVSTRYIKLRFSCLMNWVGEVATGMELNLKQPVEACFTGYEDLSMKISVMIDSKKLKAYANNL